MSVFHIHLHSQMSVTLHHVMFYYIIYAADIMYTSFKFTLYFYLHSCVIVRDYTSIIMHVVREYVCVCVCSVVRVEILYIYN